MKFRAWICHRKPVKQSGHDEDETSNSEEESDPEGDVPVRKFSEHALDADEGSAELVLGQWMVCRDYERVPA